MVSEAWFVAGYALLLFLVAVLLEWIARGSHERIHRAKTVGFQYHGHLNAWQCSEGTFLRHAETDRHARIVRFRAEAKVCNGCRIKHHCTDSDEGRELIHPLDAWPRSEMARFQRALSLSLIVLAALFCAIEAVRQAGVPVRVFFLCGVSVGFVLARRELGRLKGAHLAAAHPAGAGVHSGPPPVG
ncbi:MAG TPA: hypothetical protein VJX91_04760 [Candidatus Eisenbacteria bacterium]|nr:hypothetical protein [Candidatus Eisenbacteria bacterium]